ncbi:F-actin capping protein, alpha subunit domain-containing protein [Rozella allomycis CSF55]|uniref:F-actin-capping protein subunit alpha n=1 Tax=Rozella allomycis (strain CSF55) TaxID=988480 RepID=A0A075AUP8_ROZAC|nr:F-actin capping protein, alpha subunit domain-containing protein [Rozella allomycis CSF55]|eukprot:EPZ34011.1 F-actin capping protein, alpha subunit domain-containing protein [Rozella allomycis CSF55]
MLVITPKSSPAPQEVKLEMEVTEDEKRQIVMKFIESAPPGALGDIVNVSLDLRVILQGADIDSLLKESCKKYNENNYAITRIDDEKTQNIVCSYNKADTEKDLYYNPKSGTIFSIDHLSLEGKSVGQMERNEDEVTTEYESYLNDYYSNPHSLVLKEGKELVLICTAVKNAKWSSIWKIDEDKFLAIGTIKADAHYFEDGNVQMKCQKEFQIKLDSMDAKTVVKKIKSLEEKFQLSISESYEEICETTFKSLRRALPVTRNKIDWEKILTYKIGSELVANKEK